MKLQDLLKVMRPVEEINVMTFSNNRLVECKCQAYQIQFQHSDWLNNEVVRLSNCTDPETKESYLNIVVDGGDVEQNNK